MRLSVSTVLLLGALLDLFDHAQARICPSRNCSDDACARAVTAMDGGLSLAVKQADHSSFFLFTIIPAATTDVLTVTAAAKSVFLTQFVGLNLTTLLPTLTVTSTLLATQKTILEAVIVTKLFQDTLPNTLPAITVTDILFNTQTTTLPIATITNLLFLTLTTQLLAVTLDKVLLLTSLVMLPQLTATDAIS